MKHFILFAAGFLALVSCTDQPETAAIGQENTSGLITFNNFEAQDGWGEPVPSLNKERAFSGLYSVKTDKDLEFSYGYSKLLGQVTNRKPESLELSAKVFVPSARTGNAELVFSITDPATNETVLYNGVKLNEVKAFGEWVEVTETVRLPENVEPSHKLNIYLWRNAATAPVYLDDLKLSAVYK